MRKANLKMISERDWTPVRRGKVYCSPRCGCGCTWAEHQKAIKDAEALARKMGIGWEPEVWENMGWHYQVTKGIAKITPPHHGGGTYMAWLEIFPHDGQAIQVIETADNPEDALGFATQKLRTLERRIADGLAALL